MSAQQPVNVTTLPPGFTKDNTLGALVIGNSLGALLFGVLATQVYYYFEHHPGDGRIYKGLVSVFLATLRTPDPKLFCIGNHDSIVRSSAYSFHSSSHLFDRRDCLFRQPRTT